jgi:spermidine synthase
VSTDASLPEGPVLGRGRTALLLATVFFSGTAVMAVEMTAVRALQPFFGSTTYVWTNVIAVVLAALAVGYAVGGRVADRRPSPTLLYGLLGAGGLLLVGTAFLVTPVSRLFLADLDLEGVMTVLLRGSLAVALILFAPPILLLGAISPLAIRLLSRGGVGRAAGRVFATSTVGSILGTYLPALVLVPHVGSRGSILVGAAILLVASAVGLAAFRGSGKGLAAAALLLAVGATSSAAAVRGVAPDRGAPPLPEGGRAEVLAELESPYQYLTVRDDGFPTGDVYRILTINEGVYTYHSLRVKGRVLTNSRYYDDYTLLPFLLDLEPGAGLRAGLVGLACGVNVAQWRHFWGDVYRIRVDGAELDPAVIELGHEFFDLPDDEGLRIFAADGRQMLAALPEGERYHMLVVDAFANELYIPFHLGTLEFFALCRSRLEPGGVLAMNVYAVGEEAPNLLALENTLATAFGRCVRVRQYWGTNFLLLARNGEEPPDVSRLAARRVQDRFRRWDGFLRWIQTPEWDDLIALARRVPGSSSVIEPRDDRRVLTDDHAPLEWLTDRFLDRLERETLEGDDPRVAKLRRLMNRQSTGLALAGGGWAVLLLVGFLALRSLRMI